MLIQTAANIYRIHSETVPSREELIQAVSSLHNDDFIIEIHTGETVSFCTRTLLNTGMVSAEIRIPSGPDCFEKARKIISETGFVLITAGDGNYITCLKDIPTYYVHPYSGKGDYDLEFLNRSDCLVLNDCNEYSVLLLRALDRWTGKKIILCGKNWKPFMDVLHLPQKEINYFDECNEELKNSFNGLNTLYVDLFLPKKDNTDRYLKSHLLCYDEVMTLTCLFCCEKHMGEKNKGRKFFIVNGAWTIEGIFGIWDKAFCASRYVQKKGYIPVFHITWSDDNIYSDEKGEDIWGKFFNQPHSYTVNEVMESDSVTLSPNMNILNILQFIMNSMSDGEELIWETGIFNNAVEDYINDKRDKFLPDPGNTLGVLIRGTDYTKTHMAGHSVHADTDMVIEKIRAAEKEWKNYKYIYLSTEDSEIFEKMKSEFGDRLLSTDQERFSIKEGQLLYELHGKNKEKGKGFRLGAEYLCTIRLLSECESLIASGNCGGVTEALRENGGKYDHTYIFDLGYNPV